LDSNTRRVVYGQSNQPTNLLIASPNSVYRRTLSSNRFNFTGERRPAFLANATNLFNKVWIYNRFIVSNNGNITLNITKFNEYFRYTNINAGIGLPFVGIVLLSNDEFFLNRIEAHVMNGQLELANAELQYFLSLRIYDNPSDPLDDFNPVTDQITIERVTAKYPVIPNEYTPFYPLIDDVQKSYIKAIAEIRRKEFLHEGLRWFDIKRFALEVRHEIYNQPTNILTKNDLRRALQIPLAASNAGLEKNPR
ncbi:MAG TPA: RagB/SusD family nutrient uptake outer membrane protein, partial [Flavobacterium sp.]